MTSQPAEFPADLRELFVDSDVRPRSLSVPLPPGRKVHGDEWSDERPALWVSDAPAPAGLWPLLHAEHEHSGLWPLLLESLHGEAARPWDDGELWPDATSSPTGYDPGQLLASWWAANIPINEEANEVIAATAPYGRRWPGLATLALKQMAPARLADECAEQLLRAQPGMRLGLVATERGSDAITVCGWQGAVNYANVAKLSAVLRSWEDRFGVRVIGVGFDTLYLSVSAPPTDTDEALQVAAEHFAFCPDNVWQGYAPCTLAGYAERLVDSPIWSFWWD